MRRCNSSERFTAEEVVAGDEEVSSGWVKSFAPEQEGVQPQLHAHAGITLVVGKLNVGNLDNFYKSKFTRVVQLLGNKNEINCID